MALSDQLEGKTLHGADNEKIGKITGVYNDVQTGKPEWIAVSTGMFGKKETLVPVVAATENGDEVVVPYDKDLVKSAPHHDPDAELSVDAERDLFTHYGVPYGGETATATGSGTQSAPPAGATAEELVLHEERAKAGVQQVAAGQARLRKVVVTETEHLTVPVRHEEAVITREKVDPAATDGTAFSEQEIGVQLHAEKAVVGTEAVAVEKVHLGTKTITENETVEATTRREELAGDTDLSGKPHPGNGK